MGKDRRAGRMVEGQYLVQVDHQRTARLVKQNYSKTKYPCNVYRYYEFAVMDIITFFLPNRIRIMFGMGPSLIGFSMESKRHSKERSDAWKLLS